MAERPDGNLKPIGSFSEKEIMIEGATPGKILICSVLFFIFVSCQSPAKSVDILTTHDDESPDLDSMTFLSSWFSSGKVTLSHGEYRRQTFRGTAAETVVKLTDNRAMGIVKGSKTMAVILATDTGGSGKFYDLALISKEREGWANTDSVFLGDRVQIHSLAIKGNTIVLLMKTHASKDPMCCPTLEKVKSFTVKENKLVSVADERSADKTSEIVGTVWHWVQTLYSDDKKVVSAAPKAYTVQFMKDGLLNVRADCNLKGGIYSIKGNQLSINITHSTMAACPEGSLEGQFVRGLTAGTSYFLKEGYLYIGLKFDTGTMKFER